MFTSGAIITWSRTSSGSRHDPECDTDTQDVVDADTENMLDVLDCDPENMLDVLGRDPEDVFDMLDRNKEDVLDRDPENVLDRDPKNVLDVLGRDTKEALDHDPDGVLDRDSDKVLDCDPDNVLDRDPDPDGVLDRDPGNVLLTCLSGLVYSAGVSPVRGSYFCPSLAGSGSVLINGVDPADTLFHIQMVCFLRQNFHRHRCHAVTLK